MNKVTMIGCDVHEATLVLKVAGGPRRLSAKEFCQWRRRVDDLLARGVCSAARCPADRAGLRGQGFGLYDQLRDAGIECYVLAPTHLPHTTHRRKNKSDDKDAEMLLDEVRGYVLAGRKLPAVRVPDPQTRDDREAVRMRLELGEQRTRIKYEPYTGGRDRSASGTPVAEYDPPSTPTIRRQRTDEIVFSNRGTTE